MSSVKYRQDAPTFQGRKSTKHHEHAKEPAEKRPLFYLNGVIYHADIPRTGNGYQSYVHAGQAVSRSRRHIRTREHGKRGNARAHVLNANALDEFRRSRIRYNILSFFQKRKRKRLTTNALRLNAYLYGFARANGYLKRIGRRANASRTDKTYQK